MFVVPLVSARNVTSTRVPLPVTPERPTSPMRDISPVVLLMVPGSKKVGFAPPLGSKGPSETETALSTLAPGAQLVEFPPETAQLKARSNWKDARSVTGEVVVWPLCTMEGPVTKMPTVNCWPAKIVPDGGCTVRTASANALEDVMSSKAAVSRKSLEGFIGTPWDHRIFLATARARADPPFGFAQGKLFGDDNKKGNSEGSRSLLTARA